MKTTTTTAVLALACCAGLSVAQPKQPKPKSQKELDALMAIQNATTADARIAAVESLLTKFADTEFKGAVLQMAAQTAQQSGDWEKTVIYAERALEANPKDYVSELMLADYYSTKTRENDLDKEEKLTKADKYAKEALDNLKTADKLRPDITDEQWASLKKDFTAQGHADLGAAAALRKKWDLAVSEYKMAVEASGTPNAELMVRAAAVETDAGKPDEAIALLDKAIAMPDVHPTTKNIAMSEKGRAQRAKPGAAKPAAAPTQVEIKK